MGSTPLIAFDVGSFYYLPQYLPVLRELEARGLQPVCVFYNDAQIGELQREVVEREGLSVQWCDSREQGLDWYRQQRPSWVVYGNHHRGYTDLAEGSRSAMLYHGIGVKACYYDAELAQADVRFVEGPFRLAELQRRFPDARFVDTGFAKLDPLLGDGSAQGLNLAELGLDPARPTVLYAPTYYPSSIELLPMDWPQRLPGTNVLIKAHFFSMVGADYAAQRARLARWAKLPNVHVASTSEYNLLPFMASADVMVSEASSALFEFAALDKPVIWCDFYKLRWSYRGPLAFRHRRRMDKTIEAYRDVGVHVGDPGRLIDCINGELVAPGRLAAQRRRCTEQLIGRTDGAASRRIVDHLLGQG